MHDLKERPALQTEQLLGRPVSVCAVLDMWLSIMPQGHQQAHQQRVVSKKPAEGVTDYLAI